MTAPRRSLPIPQDLPPACANNARRDSLSGSARGTSTADLQIPQPPHPVCALPEPQTAHGYTSLSGNLFGYHSTPPTPDAARRVPKAATPINATPDQPQPPPTDCANAPASAQLWQLQTNPCCIPMTPSAPPLLLTPSMLDQTSPYHCPHQ